MLRPYLKIWDWERIFGRAEKGISFGHLTDLKKIEVKDDVLIFGAGVTYTEIQEYLSKFFPFLDSYWDRIAGWQVRNMGTIGGNILCRITVKI